MSPEQFSICLEFHKELIRPTISQKTVDGAMGILISNSSTGNRQAKDLAANITDRFEALKKWAGNKSEGVKIALYNKKNNKRNPSNRVFLATFDFIGGSVMHAAAKRHGVNDQCIKVLAPRIKRWDKYAKLLNESV